MSIPCPPASYEEGKADHRQGGRSIPVQAYTNKPNALGHRNQQPNHTPGYEWHQPPEQPANLSPYLRPPVCCSFLCTQSPTRATRAHCSALGQSLLRAMLLSSAPFSVPGRQKTLILNGCITWTCLITAGRRAMAWITISGAIRAALAPTG